MECISIWQGVVCVLPLVSVREWQGSECNRQQVVSCPLGERYNVIHYSVATSGDMTNGN
jgi:hypothetical protein